MVKTILRKLISNVSTHFNIHSLIKLSDMGLIMPFYHSVSDVDLPHLKHLYPVCTSHRFKEDLNFFQQHFEAVSYRYLLKNNKEIDFRKSACFYLTFDDGLREFHDVVAPILLELKIPATCFINTAFIDNKDMFFRMKASILIDRLTSSTITPLQNEKIVTIFNKYKFNYKLPNDLLLISDQNKALLDEVASIVGEDFMAYLAEKQPYLTTGQIQNLIKQGFSIGAHSVTHPYFQTLSQRDQIAETMNSVNYLTKKFGIHERLFSFPYTDFEIKKSFFNSISNEVDMTFGTANMKIDAIPTNFQRIPMEIWKSKNAESILKGEYLSFILKKMMGKHIIRRN